MENTNTLLFDDVFEIKAWASEAMNWCVAADILQGDDGSLKPQNDATRAEAAAMLQRFCENAVK